MEGEAKGRAKEGERMCPRDGCESRGVMCGVRASARRSCLCSRGAIGQVDDVTHVDRRPPRRVSGGRRPISVQHVTSTARLSDGRRTARGPTTGHVSINPYAA